jgi:hypothetical protein
MVKAKKHLTMEGLQNIVSNKASINFGLTDELKAAFPNTILALKSLAENKKNTSFLLNGGIYIRTINHNSF